MPYFQMKAVNFPRWKTHPMNDASQSIQYIKHSPFARTRYLRCRWMRMNLSFAQYATYARFFPISTRQIFLIAIFSNWRRSKTVFMTYKSKKRCFVCKLMRWMWWFTTDQTPLVARCFHFCPPVALFIFCWMRQKIALKRFGILWFVR